MPELFRQSWDTYGSSFSEPLLSHSSLMDFYMLGFRDENDKRHYNPGRHFSAYDPSDDGDCWGYKAPVLGGAILDVGAVMSVAVRYSQAVGY